MRPVIFRGKRVDGSNNWVFGNLIEAENKCFIIQKANVIIGENNTLSNSSVQEVIPETVGQMWIVSRNTVFGGDLFTAECAVSGSNDKAIRVCKVEECNEGFGIAIWFEGDWWGYRSMDFTTMKIIGTIHDNPELILPQCKK